MSVLELRSAAVRVEVPEADSSRTTTRTLLTSTSLVLSEQRVAVIGANGSGKSTLARLFNGLVEPTSGQVLVDGLDVARKGSAVRRRVGFCFTDPAAQLVMPTCVEDVELSLRHRIKDPAERRARALEALAEHGLAAHAHDSVHHLSGGQKQMLALTGVLACEPSVVVADEPTTLLDLANTARIGSLLLSLPQQLVLVTHDLDLAQRCDRALLVDGAAVVFDGAPREAVQTYRDLVAAPSAALA